MALSGPALPMPAAVGLRPPLAGPEEPKEEPPPLSTFGLRRGTVPTYSPYVQERWELVEYVNSTVLDDVAQPVWRESSAAGGLAVSARSLACSFVRKQARLMSMTAQRRTNSSTCIERCPLRTYQRRFLSTLIRRASSATLMPWSCRARSILATMRLAWFIRFPALKISFVSRKTRIANSSEFL